MVEDNLKRNLKITLEYDGTFFSGFQFQPSARTVHGELLKALEKITDSEVKLQIAARTDAGVHAAGQVVSFKTDSDILVDRLQKALNALLPSDVCVLNIQDMPEIFHARFSAVSRVYIYSIHNSPVRSAFKSTRFLYWEKPLELDAMIEASEMLVGEHDFSSFRASADGTRHSIRKMYRAGGWHEQNDVHFYFEANAFLQHMIRNIMGTLLWVGQKKISPEIFRQIIASKNRQLAGPTVAAHGLCLMRVVYDPEFS
jgi:tRNA pseudouridine38-40 synthase